MERLPLPGGAVAHEKRSKCIGGERAAQVGLAMLGLLVLKAQPHRQARPGQAG